MYAIRSYYENKEPLLRSDWTTYRGGAIFINGAEDCSVINCEFDQVGGNCIFVNNYNRRITIKGCYIHNSGANGVSFVGDPESVRSPLFRYGQHRITSYNVCYTKLLRLCPPAGNDPSRYQTRQYHAQHVITSYSIHYTKLYDSTHRS